jgi:hypothetical protein
MAHMANIVDGIEIFAAKVIIDILPPPLNKLERLFIRHTEGLPKVTLPTL